MAAAELNLVDEPDVAPGQPAMRPEPFRPASVQQEPIETVREQTRGDLARGLLWLLFFVVGGVLVFIGWGRLEGSVLSESIFPSLIALAGTALGFYFGSGQISSPPPPPPPPAAQAAAEQAAAEKAAAEKAAAEKAAAGKAAAEQAAAEQAAAEQAAAEQAAAEQAAAEQAAAEKAAAEQAAAEQAAAEKAAAQPPTEKPPDKTD